MPSRTFFLTTLLFSACGGGPEVVASAPVAAEFRYDTDLLRAYKALPEGERRQHDSIAILSMRPNGRWAFDWPEHPAGEIRRATNARGFNEFKETEAEPPALRILIAGDSHTEGVVSNDESFPNVLEERLRAELDGTADVINAGVGYTGPRGYLGTLRKHLELAPDVFVATLFIGNDFWNDLHLAYLKGLEGRPAPGEEYYAPLKEAEAAWSAPCWQGVNQIYRFTRFPEEQERALDAVEATLLETAELCARSNVRFVVVVLPTKYDVDLTEQREEFRELARHLGLSEEDMGLNVRLAEELLRRVDSAGIEHLDATPDFRAETEPLYWRRDHHLNVRGHAKLAEMLERKLALTAPR